MCVQAKDNIFSGSAFHILYICKMKGIWICISNCQEKCKILINLSKKNMYSYNRYAKRCRKYSDFSFLQLGFVATRLKLHVSVQKFYDRHNEIADRHVHLVYVVSSLRWVRVVYLHCVSFPLCYLFVISCFCVCISLVKSFVLGIYFVFTRIRVPLNIPCCYVIWDISVFIFRANNDCSYNQYYSNRYLILYEWEWYVAFTTVK